MSHSTAAVVPTRFHLSLNVSNLAHAVAFFEKVLGCPAAKRRDDYAKFEIDSPPMVISLEPGSPDEQGSFNHAGFRFPDSTSLVEAQRRLEAAGISTQREEGVECCYSKQTKFWVHDEDHRLWEFYVLEGEIDHRGAGQSAKAMGLDVETTMRCRTHHDAPIVWEHRMGSLFEIPAGPLDEIRLRGTFNVPTNVAQMSDTLEACFNALHPGGRIELHMLTAEDPIDGDLSLSGPAAYVKQVPVRLRLMQLLEGAGFTDLQLTTFRSSACFEFEGQPLRETRITAARPVECSDEECTVVFRGPFKLVADDEGHVWERGVPVSLSRSRWAALSLSSVGSMFTELPEVVAVGRCGG